MEIFGKRLRLLREEKDLTQIELAKILSLTNSTISQYEAGKRMPEQGILQKIADIFDVSVDYLLGRTDDPESPGHFNKGPDPSHEEKITSALVDDPELFDFWQALKKRDELRILFKQVKPLSEDSIRRIIKYIKMVEDEITKER